MERILRIALLVVLSVISSSIHSQNRKATFPGGNKALAHFIDMRVHAILDYREVYRTVVVLRIDKNGIPSISKFIKVVEEKREIPQARKIVSQMPRWKPALKNGKPVVSYITLKFPMGDLTDDYLSQLYRDGKLCENPDKYPDFILNGYKDLQQYVDSYLGKDKKYGKGHVGICYIINKNGSMSDPYIRYPSNNPYLDRKVLEAVKRLRHKPAEFRGQKVRYRVGIRYYYTE